MLALVPGPDGELWVGTGAGLARLHKGSWEVYTPQNSDLPDDAVQALAWGPDGALWVGTRGGLARFHDESWRVFTAADSGLPRGTVEALALGADGAVWVGLRGEGPLATEGGGLARYHEGTWEVFTAENSDLPDDRVAALTLGPGGELWVGTWDGLGRFHEEAWDVFTPESSDLVDNWVDSLALGQDGALWVGTLEGLARLEDGSWQEFTAENSGLPASHVRSLAVGDGGEIWTGTSTRGLARLHEARWQAFTPKTSPLPGSYVRCLAVGREGELWVGTSGGLVRLQESLWQVFTSENSALPDDRIEALEWGRDGALWIGTLSGLVRLLDGSWQVLTPSNSGLPDSSVTALAAGPEGELWAGTTHGLAHLHEGSWEAFAPSEGWLPDRRVFSVTRGTGGALWVGTRHGVGRYHEGSWRVYTEADSRLPDDLVVSLVQGADGALWAGTGSGLARFAEGSWRTFTPSDTGLPAAVLGSLVWSVVQGPEGSMWAGTGGGLVRFRQGDWEVFTRENSDLPDDGVGPLAWGPAGELWLGSGGGLSRFHEGSWNSFTPSNSDLPGGVNALAPGPDGKLWVGTTDGLARFAFRKRRPEIVELVGAVESGRRQRITQRRHTFAAVPFDPTFQTEGRDWRFRWELELPTGELTTRHGRDPYFEARLDREGRYTVRVQAIDKHGFRSESRVHDLEVELPEDTLFEAWARRVLTGGSALSAVYFLAIFPLLLLYPYAGWARSLVNSGTFSRFPVLHKLVLNTSWARSRLFRSLAESALRGAEVPEPYIPQEVLLLGREISQRLAVDGSSESLHELFGASRKVLVLGRSGTGKSVLLRFLERESARRFLAGEDARVPVLLDLRTHPIAGREVEDLIRDALRGGGGRRLRSGGVEVPDSVLDHLVRKGGFILLIDSLNELPGREEVQSLHPFFNRDASNYTVIASQADLLERRDFVVHGLSEVTEEQARSYLSEAVGWDAWEALPEEAKALTPNPQDLELLGEVLRAIGPDRPLPSRRAGLYREILDRDALADRARTGGAAMQSIYAVAFRMVRERRVVSEEQLRGWLRSELSERGAFREDVMARLEAAIGRSRMFRQEELIDVLGRRQPATGLRHELVGKFLASRHVREVLLGPDDDRRVQYLALSREEEWSEVFYFVVDELDSRSALAEVLEGLLDQGGAPSLRAVAYALGTKPEEMIAPEIRQAYGQARLGQDLKDTPASRNA